VFQKDAVTKMMERTEAVIAPQLESIKKLDEEMAEIAKKVEERTKARTE